MDLLKLQETKPQDRAQRLWQRRIERGRGGWTCRRRQVGEGGGGERAEARKEGRERSKEKKMVEEANAEAAYSTHFLFFLFFFSGGVLLGRGLIVSVLRSLNSSWKICFGYIVSRIYWVA